MESKIMRPKSKNTVVMDGIVLKPNEKSSKGTYVCTITASNGQRFNRGCGESDLGLAFVRAREIRDEIEAVLKDTDGKTIKKFSTVFEEFLKHLEDEGRSERDMKAYRTTFNRMVGQRIDNVRGTIHHHDRQGRPIVPLIGPDDPAHMITFEQWKAWFRHHLDNKILGNSSLRGHITRISFLYEFAADKKYEIPKVDFRESYEDVSEDHHKSRDFTEAEVEKLLEYFKNSRHPHNYYRFLTLLHTGLRLSEMCSLRRENIDWVGKTIKVKRLKKKKKVLESIAISKTLAKALETWIRKTEKYNSEWVFCKPDGSMYSAQGQWLTKACSKLGINGSDGEKIVCHSTRSRYITRQIQAGVPLPSIQQSVSHRFHDTTLRYSRLAPIDASNTAADVMEDLENKRQELKKEMEKLEITIDDMKNRSFK